MDEHTEKILVKRAKQGDDKAFQQLYEWYKQRIYTYVHSRLGDGPQAEDETQEIFLKAWKKLNTFEGRSGARFGTWLWWIAINHCRNITRRHRPDVTSISLSVLLPEGLTPKEVEDFFIRLFGTSEQATPEKILIDQELAHVIQQAIRELLPHQREAFIRARFDGEHESEFETEGLQWLIKGGEVFGAYTPLSTFWVPTL